MLAVSSKIFDRYRDKLSKIDSRTDIYLSDWKRLNKISAHVLFGYDKSCGLLKADELIKYALSSFNGKLELDEKTIKIYPEGCVSVIAKIKAMTKPIGEAKSMKCTVAETMYLDEKLKDIWEVQSNEEGKYLARIEKDDIANILAERKKRMFTTTASLNFEEVTAGTFAAEVGDKIEFYFDDKVHKGEVKNIDENGLKVKCETGKDYCIDKEAVLKIVDVAPKTKENIKKELETYYSKMFGKELGKEIVKGK